MMLRKFKRVRWALLVIPIVLAVGAVGSVGAVIAQSTGDDNIIYGAYAKVNGLLRIISNPDEVRPSESLISWNKIGPQGPEGSQGPQGPEGPAVPASGTLMSSYRVQVFGHTKHDLFSTTSTDYVSVPHTFSSGGRITNPMFPDPVPGTTRYYRVEVSFADNHDDSIYLRMRDPLNNYIAWEYSFQAGHAYNDWISWRTTPRVLLSAGWLNDPWPRQYGLEMKASDGDGSHLYGVWIVIEDIIP